MAFNTLEYLEAGKVDFVYRLSMYDNESLINSIRNSSRKNNIIDGFLPLLIKRLPHFCFRVIYDNEKYEKEAWYALNKCYTFERLPKEILIDILNKTNYGIKYFKKHYNDIITKYYDDLDFIIEYMFSNYDIFKNRLKELSLTTDMHLRFIFMSYLINNKSYLFKTYYSNLTKYLIDYNYKKNEQLSFLPNLMSSADISKLAFDIFESPLKDQLYPEIKEFIAKKYTNNEIAYHLTKLKKKLLSKYDNNTYEFIENKEGIKEFNADADWYFNTTNRGKLYIYKHYTNNISKELLIKFKHLLEYFDYEKDSLHSSFSKVDEYGLSNVLEEYVTKYLDLSKTDEHYFISNGSTAEVYRIGDYVFKLIQFKWSFEETICPDLYIILPNLEEVLLRDNKQKVIAGIEIQKYLSRDAKDVPSEIWNKFRKELSRLGYYTTDTLMYGTCGDNCRLLDSYKDSGNLKPPYWFKKYPIVIVDRDRIYKNENIYPKQIRSHY